MKSRFISIFLLQLVSGQSENCISENQVIFKGECVDLLKDGLCTERGQRLYEEESGELRCDCLDGWLSKNGKCYQEFTKDLECGPQNKIIKLKENSLVQDDYECINNPCDEPNRSPHRDTWVSDKEHECHKVPNNIDDVCELAVDWDVDEDAADLKCCDFSNRSTCNEDPYKFLNAFSVFLQGSTPPCKAKCRYSEIKQKCIKKSRNAKVKCSENVE